MTPQLQSFHKPQPHQTSEKRLISLEEKKTLNRTDKLALTLLGPEFPEVAELKQAGFVENLIVGIDRTVDNCTQAGKVYPKMTIFCGEFARFWKTKGYQDEWGYIHLDFCGQATPNMISQAIGTLDSIVSGGRLRVTFSGSLARLDRAKEESFLLEQVLAKVNIACAGRARLVDARYYTSSFIHRETYITAWWDKK
jgi:hypothetical protein